MKIKIGGIIYRVEYTDSINMNGELANTDFDKCLIRIDKTIDKQQQYCALIHELLHCINNQLSEKDVEFLAMSIYQIIKDNKTILKELFKDN